MKVRRRALQNIIFILILLISGSIVSCSPSSKTPPLNQEQEGTQQPASINPQARELLNLFSEAFEDAAAKVNPSVVPIFAEEVIKVQNPFGAPDDLFRQFFGDEFFKRFFGNAQKEQKETVHSLGSGVIVTKDGYILTNNHVIQGAEKMTVVLSDKRKYLARLIGADPPTDVAVIKIEANDLPAATLGNSDNVRVGQWVIAVGNPFQLLHTVTAGIISAKGRSSIGLADFEDFIQTDASINPGNSGGALADLDGNVIAINTAINTPSGGNVGIGFAIPSNMAKGVMETLMAGKKIMRGYLGILPQDINQDLAKALNLKSTEGGLVGDVTPGGPADKAGMRRGDIIIEFNGKKIVDSSQLRNMVAQSLPGSSVKITLLRNGREMTVTAVLGERPKSAAAQEAPESQPEEQSSKKLGLSIQPLTPEIEQQLGFRDESGVVVASVSPGGPAEDAGLQPGDLIKEVNRVEIKTVQDFNRAVSTLRSGSSAALLVRRGDNTFFLAIQVP